MCGQGWVYAGDGAPGWSRLSSLPCPPNNCVGLAASAGAMSSTATVGRKLPPQTLSCAAHSVGAPMQELHRMLNTKSSNVCLA